MDSYKFSKLHDKIAEAMTKTDDENLKQLLESARVMTVDMQEEVKQENENLSFLGIYTTDISNIIDICEDAVKSVGKDISDYNDMVSIDYGRAENDNITNVVIAEYLYQAECVLQKTFERNGLDIQVDSYTNGSDSHLYAGNEEVHSGEDVQLAVLSAVQNQLKSTLKELNIPAEVLEESEQNPIIGETIKETIQNITERIAGEIEGMASPEVWEENDGTIQIELYAGDARSSEPLELSGSTIDKLGDMLEEAVWELEKEQIEQG